MTSISQAALWMAGWLTTTLAMFNAVKAAAIVLGFAGIVMIVRPGAAAADMGHVLALAAALGFGCTLTLTKYVTRRDSPLTVIFLMFAIQCVIGAVPAVLTWEWPEPQNWTWVAVVGLAGTFSHFCLSKALSLADASLVTPMDFLRVPLTALLGYWLYQEGLDLYAVLGAALILAANTINLVKAQSRT